MKRISGITLLIIGFLWLAIGWKIIQINGNDLFWCFVSTKTYGTRADWTVYAETLNACAISIDLMACVLIKIGAEIIKHNEK